MINITSLQTIVTSLIVWILLQTVINTTYILSLGEYIQAGTEGTFHKTKYGAENVDLHKLSV